ncbi:adenosylcobinamide-phosphate guanylyltransferase [Stanieria cyanosphaera PCC 7437]|uniref:Adenosylcobinamide kinase n=1 Tax=Stanieria cyanosphaera (strain ATCC 29371 / PCC 7437) TaxID=111780 RepID=K9XS38_STAC7|nr:bifunctional adenosylcobinamide kinase/adenosylcobinamide-phosphate guanylyltransferase [Stanieria cyanosphaera]AFZ35420.1 adenosylcobinamide-phosphate guanylyltransferase [Stanieria cyanosphaera PCC 7437]
MNSIQADSKQVILVTGASRSGKSEWAEILAQKTNQSVVYIATAIVDSTDPEWQARIIKHQSRRPQQWQTLVVTKDLVTVINNALASECLLIDSLGTWVANLLDLDASIWSEITHNLINSLNTTAAEIILVGEETGWGVVPAYQSGRIFRDRLSDLLRQIGGIADCVYLVVGGHILNLSQLGQPLKQYEG